VVVETPSGYPNVQVVRSYFVAVAENTLGVQQIYAIARLLATMALNREARLVSNDDFENERAVMLSFVMRRCGLDGTVADPDGSYQDARNLLMSQGFFNSHYKPGVRSAANSLGNVENLSAMYLRQHLGQDAFNAMLTSVGCPANRRWPSALDRVTYGDGRLTKKDRETSRTLRKSSDPQHELHVREMLRKSSKRRREEGQTKGEYRTDERVTIAYP